jgi:hypothetical protein
MSTTSTRTRKAPAKVAEKVDLDVVNNDTGETAEVVKTIYVAEAQGRGGKVNRRKVGHVPAQFAVDCADPEGKSPAAKAGLIFSFHATEEQAKAAAERYAAKGLDAVIVEATSTPVASS